MGQFRTRLGIFRSRCASVISRVLLWRRGNSGVVAVIFATRLHGKRAMIIPFAPALRSKNRWVARTSDYSRAICEFLDFLFREHTKDDDAVKTLLEALFRFFESFGIDEAAINLGPASTGWNTLLCRLPRVSIISIFEFLNITMLLRLSEARRLLAPRLALPGTSPWAS